MQYVKDRKLLLSTRTHILKIKEQTSFGQTFQKIKKVKNADFVLIEKAKSPQMLAALILKLAGRKFFWIQNFSNPPVPSLLAKMLISQADNIIVDSKRDFYKLKSFGIKSAKIIYLRRFKVPATPIQPKDVDLSWELREPLKTGLLPL